jgi:acyl-CoA synthetase (AMP-forming)/AMP-acid ligase II
MLPDEALDQTALRFWRDGARRDFSGWQFWRLVQAHMARIEATPDSGGVCLVLGHTAADQMALFVALIAAGRLAALFPPNTPLQDEAAYFHQQRSAFGKIDPARIYILEERLAETIRRVGLEFAARVVLVESHEGQDLTGIDPSPARRQFRARLSSAAPIFVQHSSGTTGIKKAVAITGQALAAQYTAYWPGLRTACATNRLAIASWLPLYHDMGLLTSLLLPLLGGDQVSLTDAFEWIAKPGLLFDMIEQDGCGITWLPNFAFRHLVRLRPGLPRRALGSMRMWIDCSEPCRLADAAAFEHEFAAWGVRPGSVVGCYAMAETVFAASQCPLGEQRALYVPHAVAPGAELAAAGARVLDQADAEEQTSVGQLGGGKHVLSSGRAVPGMEIAVLAGDQPAADGVYGEIALRGPFLFSGYRGLSGADSSIGADGFFRTGDLGTVIDGHVYIFGRTKEIIIVNGKNLFAGDIEDVINGVSGVHKGRAVAFGVDSAQTGSEELIVVAEHNAESGTTIAETRMAVSRAVSEQFLIKPRDVRIVEGRWLVKSTSGKMSRDENRRKYIDVFRSKPGKPVN